MNESTDYTARHECSFVQAGNMFYLFGGRESPEKVDIYDYSRNKWTHGAQAPKPFNHFQAVAYEGLIWVIGAFETNHFPNEEPQENVYVYDPANDVWMKGPEIPWPRGAGGLVVYKDRFYLVGGNTLGHNGGFVPWLDKYNPVSGEWDRLEDAPHQRDHFHAAVLRGRLYAIGGRRTIRGNTLGDTVKEVDVYDFATKKWLVDNLPKDIPLPRASAAVATFDGKIMVIGGETAKNTAAHTRVDAFDPANNGRWSSLKPLNHGRHGMQAIVSGEGVFVAGGSPNRGGGQQRKMEVYNINAPQGKSSHPGLLSVFFGKFGSVTLQHVGGNQGVFVNSIVLTGPNASNFRIRNKATSRILIKRNGKLTLSVEYKGDAEEATAQMVVAYSGKKRFHISLPVKRQ
jgi:hypothetical protein